MRPKLRKFILQALAEMHGEPLTQPGLCGSVRMVYPRIMDSEIAGPIKELEREGYLSGVRDEITDEISWSLTLKGKAAANEL